MGLFMQNSDKKTKEYGNNQNIPSNYYKEISLIQNELKEIRESIDFINMQVGAFFDSLSSFKKYINDEETFQTNYLTDIQAKLKRIDTSVNVIPSIADGMSKINKLDGIEDAVGNIDYNIRNASSSGGDSEYKEELSKKLSEYEEDLYMKLMRKYVIDSQISLYVQINDQSRIHGTDSALKQVLDLIINKLDAIGIKAYSSKPGDTFDPKHMTTGHYPNIETEIEDWDGKVAESVTPSFIWSLPTMRQQSDQMLLKEEEVILYKYVKKEYQNE